MGNLVDLAGRVFGRLTVSHRVANRYGSAAAHWHCQCECGNTVVVASAELLRKPPRGTKSCGCLVSEHMRKVARRHGGVGSVEYHAWHAMKQRCYLRTLKAYRDYGGRGITVCDRWRDSFPNFLADMGPRPSPQHSLDRIDNNGNYEPGNCRWATWTVQVNNRRPLGRKVAHVGVTLNIAQLSNHTGLSVMTIRRRLAAGWSVNELASKRAWHRRQA